jgi:flagellar biosynthesis protein FliP
MIRAVFYLAASALIWLAEGFLFSYFLQFQAWQVVLMAIVYSCLVAIAVQLLRRQAATYVTESDRIAVWRYLSLAPMIVLVVGSFASLPILLVIAGLGKLVGA